MSVKRTRSAFTVEAPAFRYRKPVRGSLVWWLRCLGIAAFLIVLMRLPASREASLSHIDLRWLGVCMLLTILQLVLEAAVWQWLLALQHIRYPYPKTLVTYLASQYLGLVTPGHVGAFLGAGYISMDTGLTVGYALSSVVMKKILLWVAVVGFGIWSLPLLGAVPFLQGVEKVVWASAIVLVSLSAAIALWVFSLRRLAKKWQRLSPWQIDLTDFWAGMRQLGSWRLLGPLALAALAFSVLFLQLDAVLRSLGVVRPLLTVAKIMALSRIAAKIVPVSFVGFGSKDAAIILLLAHRGLEVPTGITVTLLLLLCSYLVTLLLSGLCWWVRPLVIPRAAPSSS